MIINKILILLFLNTYNIFYSKQNVSTFSKICNVWVSDHEYNLIIIELYNF